MELYITHTYVVRTKAKTVFAAGCNALRRLKTAGHSQPYWEGEPVECAVAQHDEENLEKRVGEVQEDDE